MHYSHEATEKYWREYRRYQIKQMAYTGAIAAALLAILGACIWAVARAERWKYNDGAGATSHQGIFTVLTSSISVNKHGGMRSDVVFANVDGHKANFHTYGEKIPIKFFKPGAKAWVRYRIGHSGNVYIDDVEPLP